VQQGGFGGGLRVVLLLASAFLAAGLDSPLAGDVHAFSEDAAAGEEGAVDPLAVGVDAVGELAQHFAWPGDEVVAAQPCGPHPVQG
jgi:hypothetical protein